MRAIRGLAVLCLAGGLAACAAGETGNVATEHPAPATGKPAVAALPPAPVKPAPKPAPPLPHLMGMAREDVIRTLGEPSFRRQDAPALLLRYRGSDCILDLFLYPSTDQDKAGHPTVEHVEARTEEGDKTVTRACLAEVMKAKATAKAGRPG